MWVQGGAARRTAMYELIHEDSSTEPTQQSRKKTISRGARGKTGGGGGYPPLPLPQRRREP